MQKRKLNNTSSQQGKFEKVLIFDQIQLNFTVFLIILLWEILKIRMLRRVHIKYRIHYRAAYYKNVQLSRDFITKIVLKESDLPLDYTIFRKISFFKIWFKKRVVQAILHLMILIKKWWFCAKTLNFYNFWRSHTEQKRFYFVKIMDLIHSEGTVPHKF